MALHERHSKQPAMSDTEHHGEGEADLFAQDMTHDDDVPSFPAGVGMADVMAKILGQVHQLALNANVHLCRGMDVRLVAVSLSPHPTPSAPCHCLSVSLSPPPHPSSPHPTHLHPCAATCRKALASRRPGG